MVVVSETNTETEPAGKCLCMTLLPTRSSMPDASATTMVPSRSGFQIMALMMLLPVIIGAVAGMLNSWGGFLEAAFLDMTLSLELFDYGFGPGKCGDWVECGNSTFDSYVSARNLSMVLFVVALVAVALKDMIKGGFDVEMSLDQVDSQKTLPEMLKYSLLVFLILFIFPPMWDFSAGLMNNVGIWILNPHYNFVRDDGEYIHGKGGNMCRDSLSYDDMAMLAPTARESDKWAIYEYGTGPMNENDGVADYHLAVNYHVKRDGDPISNECLNEGVCPFTVNKPPHATLNEIGDILCNPDYRVKYVFRQAIGFTELKAVSPESILSSVSGIGSDDVMVGVLMQFLKSSVTLQVIMVIFMTGVMVDVVTAFALAIIPIVPFYRFLPMSSQVKLGDYSGAAFALLAMPLVASLVLVAGSGAVANIAADGEQEFQLFFTWLAALSVLLLVIGIPATMVPLIGSGVSQATAAVQTGVQTAQFAATTVAATAGGAIRGRRDSMRFNRLQGIKDDKNVKMTKAQKIDYNQLKSQGYGQMSTARAAVMGASGGLRGQIVDEKGALTNDFRNAVAPDTKDVTGASAGGTLSGFGEVADPTKRVSGLTGSLTNAAQGVATSAAAEARKAKEPTEEELLAVAKKQEAEAKETMERKGRNLEKTADKFNKATKGEEQADEFRNELDMQNSENGNVAAAKRKIKELEGKLHNSEAKISDLKMSREVMQGDVDAAQVELDAATRANMKMSARIADESYVLADEVAKHAVTSAKIDDTKSSISTAQESLDEARSAHAAAIESGDASAAEAAAASMEQRESELKTFKNDLAGMEEENAKRFQEIRDADGSRLDMATKQHEKVSAILNEQNESIGELEKSVSKLETSIQAQTNEIERATAAAAMHGETANSIESRLVEDANRTKQELSGVPESDLTEEQRKELDRANTITENAQARSEFKTAQDNHKLAEEDVKGVQNDVYAHNDAVKDANEKQPDVDSVSGEQKPGPASGGNQKMP